MSKKGDVGGIRLKGWHVAIGLLVLVLISSGAIVATNQGIVFDWSWIFGGREPEGFQYEAPNGWTTTNYNEYLWYMETYYPEVDIDEIEEKLDLHDAAQIQFVTADYVTKAAVVTSATTFDITKAVNGIFDFLGQEDTITVGTTPDTTNVFFADGDEIVIRIGCTGNPTNGLDYYDGWYYIESLHQGNPIYIIEESAFQLVGTDPTYTYSISKSGLQKTGYVVAWTSGTTPYWDIGKLWLYPRYSLTEFDCYLTYATTQCAAVTDGAAWDDTDAEIIANATLAATTGEYLTFTMVGGAANLMFGQPQFVVTRNGEIDTYEAFFYFSTAMTAIDAGSLQSEGWEAISDGTLYAEKGFYKKIPVKYAAKGSKDEFQVKMPVDCAAATASTAYLFKVFITDFCLEANLAIGAYSRTTPTAYGFVTAYGCANTVQTDSTAAGWTTASGASDAEILRVYLTTPS